MTHDHGPDIPFMFASRFPLLNPLFDERRHAICIAGMAEKNSSIYTSVASPLVAFHVWNAIPDAACTAHTFYQLFLATGFAFPLAVAAHADADTANKKHVLAARIHTAELLVTGGLVAPIVSEYLPHANTLPEFVEHTLVPLFDFSFAQIVEYTTSRAGVGYTPSAIGTAILFNSCAVQNLDPAMTAAVASSFRKTPLFATPLSFACHDQYMTLITTAPPTADAMQWIAPYVIPMFVEHDLIHAALAYTTHISIDVHYNACRAVSHRLFDTQWTRYVQTTSISAILQAILLVWGDPPKRKRYIRSAANRLFEERLQDHDNILGRLAATTDSCTVERLVSE